MSFTHTEVKRRLGDVVIIAKEVPAWQCVDCGETRVDGPLLRDMEALAKRWVQAERERAMEVSAAALGEEEEPKLLIEVGS
jgi:YgiT-type zinc finger domain-containing protein